MKVTLMNQKHEVLVAYYYEEAKYFTKILEIKNIDYAPLIIKNAFNNNESLTNTLSTWFRSRSIPKDRDKLDMLLDRLNISSSYSLLDKAFGLSLSDQYWIKPASQNVSYDDINFFDNDFNDLEFTEASFTDKGPIKSKITFLTPNNTTDGVLRKTWIIDHKTRYLLKTGLGSEVLQPFNEVLASMISERLGFRHTTYTISVFSYKVVSKCACFVTKDTEFIPAYQVLNNTDKTNTYTTYIKILEDNGISDAQKKVDDMFILDFLMLNNDRHLNNFGVIRDVNTLKWVDVAPLFDTGNSLNLLDYDNDEIMIEGSGRFFYDIDSFDHIIRHVTDIKRIDIKKLDGVVDEFADLLHEYQYLTKMSDRRINRLCLTLNGQINKLKDIIDDKKI